MKVIFLDHQWTMYLKPKEILGKLELFDEECVKNLIQIIDTTDVEIVVSSDWKLWVNLEEMQKFYTKQGLKSPIGYTKYFGKGVDAEKRAFEINTWLKEHDVTNWVAVDDLDMRDYLTNFVWITEKNMGIKQIGIKDKILNYL